MAGKKKPDVHAKPEQSAKQETVRDAAAGPAVAAEPKAGAGKPEAASGAQNAGGGKPAGQQKPSGEMADAMKEVENALFAIRFYPVAVDEGSKAEALKKLEKAYNTGDETIRQLIIYMIHETLAASAELKIMHNFEYAKARNPALDQTQLRMNVYRAMFNYNMSLEGLVELMQLLGRLRGSDDAAKLLTYHFSHLCNYENEASHVLRAAALDALGKSDSRYALKALLEYAKYSDNERLFGRIVAALTEWDGRIDKLKADEAEKKKLRASLQEIMARNRGGTHYG